jgi:hypothetical protein
MHVPQPLPSNPLVACSYSPAHPWFALFLPPPPLQTINYSTTKVDAKLREMFPEMHGPDVSIEAVGFHYAKTLIHKVEQKVSSSCCTKLV